MNWKLAITYNYIETGLSKTQYVIKSVNYDKTKKNNKTK